MPKIMEYNQWAGTVSIVAHRDRCGHLTPQIWSWEDQTQVKIGTRAVVTSQEEPIEAFFRAAPTETYNVHHCTYDFVQ